MLPPFLSLFSRIKALKLAFEVLLLWPPLALPHLLLHLTSLSWHRLHPHPHPPCQPQLPVYTLFLHSVVHLFILFLLSRTAPALYTTDAWEIQSHLSRQGPSTTSSQSFLRSSFSARGRTNCFLHSAPVLPSIVLVRVPHKVDDPLNFG